MSNKSREFKALEEQEKAIWEESVDLVVLGRNYCFFYIGEKEDYTEASLHGISASGEVIEEIAFSEATVPQGK
ncbi:hypothetical protein [Salipaludibacillus agaradhaerens]|jgi:hypothetical protein|uniref:hypothetical protein n=1 Tax=Salipaludibacillus agaradhaerens TaxID=76935 RepID=UPI00117E1B4F|nr:hypothetical protein [Salipaludibacillus agaradhaerens]